MAGGLLLRRATRRSLRAVQMDLAAGRTPAEAIQKTLSELAAAILLIVPGVLTDLLALLLLVPISRRLVVVWLGRRMLSRIEVRGFSVFADVTGKRNGTIM